MTPRESLVSQVITEKVAGSSAEFESDHLYLIHVVRISSNPITGIVYRAAAKNHGSVTLCVVSDDNGTPDKVLYRSELTLPHGKDAGDAPALVSVIPTPILEVFNFWIGFRLSARMDVLTRDLPFAGYKTVAPISYDQLTGSLRDVPLEELPRDEKLGMPHLFALYQFEGEV